MRKRSRDKEERIEKVKEEVLDEEFEFILLTFWRHFVFPRAARQTAKKKQSI